MRSGRPAEEPVHDLGGEHAAGTPLVDRRADVGRALDVFGVGQAAGDGLSDVGDGLVALQLDVLLMVVALVDHPERERGRHVAGGPADHGEPPGPRAVVDETGLLLVVPQADAEAARELDGGVPAAADGEHIRWDRGALAVNGGHRDAGERGIAVGRDHPGVQPNLDPGCSESFRRRAGPRGWIDHDDLCAGRGERFGSVVPVVVRREDDDLLADEDAEALEVGASRRREHHAGPVVADERERPFVRAGGEYDARGAHVMEDVGAAVALVAEHIPVVVDPGGRGGGQRGGVGRRIHDDRLLVHDQHPSLPDRGRRAAGRAAPDHERLDVPVVVTRRTRRHRGRRHDAHAGSALYGQTVN